MMKRFSALLVASLLSATMLFAAACNNSSSNNNGNDNDAVTIRVDLHGWTPTVNSTSTAGSTAYNSPKGIAAEFEALHDNKVKIEWVRDKDLRLVREDVSQYFALAIENGNCPAISFTWGTTFQDRGWYIELTSFLEEENDYETASDLVGKKWRESFDDYIWNLETIKSYNDKIVAVPLTLFAGSAACVLYNTARVNAFGLTSVANPSTVSQYELGIESPFNWATYVDLVEASISEYGAQAALDASNYPYTSSNWMMQFNLGPAYMSYAAQFVDKNSDGVLSGQEVLQSVIDGHFNPVNKPYAQELLQKQKTYLSMINESNSDANMWESGTGVTKYDGSWVYTPEKNSNRSFNWEMVPAPVEDESIYTRDHVEYVSFDDAQPGADLYLNIMKAGVTKDGKLNGEIDSDKLFYSVEFLKYLTTREANSAMIDEMNTSIGAVKGAELPLWLKNSAYSKCQFAKTPSVNGWPGGFTTSYQTQLDTLFSSWIRGSVTGGDTAFYNEWNRLQTEGARAMAAALDITLT